MQDDKEFQTWIKEWHHAIGGQPADFLYSGDTVRAAFHAKDAEIDRLKEVIRGLQQSLYLSAETGLDLAQHEVGELTQSLVKSAGIMFDNRVEIEKLQISAGIKNAGLAEWEKFYERLMRLCDAHDATCASGQDAEGAPSLSAALQQVLETFPAGIEHEHQCLHFSEDSGTCVHCSAVVQWQNAKWLTPSRELEA